MPKPSPRLLILTAWMVVTTIGPARVVPAAIHEVMNQVVRAGDERGQNLEQPLASSSSLPISALLDSDDDGPDDERDYHLESCLFVLVPALHASVAPRANILPPLNLSAAPLPLRC